MMTMTPACRIKVNLQPDDMATLFFDRPLVSVAEFHSISETAGRNLKSLLQTDESGAIFFHLKKFKSRELSTDDDVPYLFLCHKLFCIVKTNPKTRVCVCGLFDLLCSSNAKQLDRQ